MLVNRILSKRNVWTYNSPNLFFTGAITIIGYKSVSDGSGADPSTFLGAALVLSLPLLFGFAIVGSRSAINGELEVNKIVRGDFKNSMRQNFDGVDFFMDSVFGASALLGIGWIASITVWENSTQKLWFFEKLLYLNYCGHEKILFVQTYQKTFCTVVTM